MTLSELWSEAKLITTEGLGHHRIVRDRWVVDEVVRFVDSRAHVDEAA